MKKITTIILAAIVLTLTGCQKETLQEGVPTDFKVVIERPAGSGEKVIINDVRKPCWEVGDSIKINNSTDGAISSVGENPTVGYITATVDPAPYYAVFPASVVTASRVTAQPNISLPRVQYYETNSAGVQKVNAPMAAYNPSSTVLEFKNLCSVVKIHVTNDKEWDMIVDSIHIEATNRSLCGPMLLLSTDEEGTANQNTIKSETPYLQVQNTPASGDPSRSNGQLLNRQDLESAKRIVSLAGENNASIDEQINISGSRDFYMYLPAIPQTALCQLTIRVFSHPVWGRTASSDGTPDDSVHIVYSRTTGNITLERNKFMSISYTLSTANPTFTSMKAFTVDANGTKVCFSRGQLQYFNPVQTSGHNRNSSNVSHAQARYRFAPRQWSFLGQTSITVDGSTSEAEVGWREYFPWATGDNPVYFASSNTLQHVANNLTGDNYKHDWGYYLMNTVKTTGNNGNYHSKRIWRTPEQAEYDYVLRNRTKSDHIKFGWATINNPKYGVVVDNQHGSTYAHIYGCILVPDAVVASTELKGGSDGLSTFVSRETANGAESNYKYRGDNVYDLAEFEYLEAKGCIFFPCIGMFVLTSPNVGNDTPYRNWTSNTAQGRFWSSTVGNQIQTQTYILWLQSRDLGLATEGGGSDYTATSTAYDDPNRYLNCVRLVCPFGTPYIWDPDQM